MQWSLSFHWPVIIDFGFRRFFAWKICLSFHWLLWILLACPPDLTLKFAKSKGNPHVLLLSVASFLVWASPCASSQTIPLLSSVFMLVYWLWVLILQKQVSNYYSMGRQEGNFYQVAWPTWKGHDQTVQGLGGGGVNTTIKERSSLHNQVVGEVVDSFWKFDEDRISSVALMLKAVK